MPKKMIFTCAAIGSWAVIFLAACSSSTDYISDEIPPSSTTMQTSVEQTTIERTGTSLAPDAPLVWLAVAGDVGTGGAEEYATAAAMDVLDEKSDFDVLMLLGDNVYEGGEPELVQETVFDPFAGVLDGETRLVAALGNHDVLDGHGPAIVEALGMPHNWYATEEGGVLIVVLDSTQSENPEQLAWLEETLAQAMSDWVIVVVHHPPFSAGMHGSDLKVQDNIVPLFERYGVDLVLSGHEHDYQRSKLVNGVTYVISGSAAKLRPTGSEDFTEVSLSVHSFVVLSIYADRIEGTAVDQAGGSIDSFTLEQPQ